MVAPTRTQRAKQPVKAGKLASAKKKSSKDVGPFHVELIDIRFSLIKAERLIFAEQSKRGRVEQTINEAKVLFVNDSEHQLTVVLFKLAIDGTDLTEPENSNPSFKVELHVEGLCQHRGFASADETAKITEIDRVFDQIYPVAASRAYELIPTIGYKNIRTKLVRPKGFKITSEMLTVLDDVD